MYVPTRYVAPPELDEHTPLLDAPDAPDETDEAGRTALPARSEPESSAAGPPKPGIHRNVVLLGLTSMVTDISSEMVASVLPLYLSLLFGFSPLQLGAFDGVYQGLTAVVCVVAALFADRRRKHKEVAALGYGLSASCRLGLAAASGAWMPVLGFLYVDRLGKGIRTAPRDALISLSSARDRLAESFGVHRALDTAGAVLGPVVAALLLARDPAGYSSVFVTSFFVAIIGLAILLLFVDGHPRRAPSPPPLPSPPPRPPASKEAGLAPPVVPVVPVVPVARPAVSLRSAARLFREPRYRLVFLVGTGLALMTPGDALLYLTFQRRADLSVAAFPLLYVGASIVFLLAAIPLGRLSDRIGRWRVFLGGELGLAGVFLVLASDARSIAALVLMLVLLGLYYAATDGVLMALASAVVPAHLRASGLASLTMAIALAHLVASLVFGAVWGTFGSVTATRLFLAGLAVALVIAAWAVRGKRLTVLA